MKIKRFISLLLTCFSITASTIIPSNVAFAAEAQPATIYEDENVVVLLGNPDDPNAELSETAAALSSARALSYESNWENGSASGNLYINTSNSGSFGVTVKIQSSDSNAFAYCSLYNPNGSVCKGLSSFYVNQNTNSGDGFLGTIVNGPSGRYKLSYMLSSSAGTRVMIWLY